MVRRWAVGLGVGWMIASLLLSPERADAHGGRLQCELAPAGPYVVSVWTAPDPARVGVVDFSASILRADTRQPASDVGMRLTARASVWPGFVEGVGSRAASGLFEFLEPSLYHVRVKIPAQGRWHVSVSIAGAAGHGDAGFDMEVAPPLIVPWSVIAVGVAVTVLLFATWFAVKQRVYPAPLNSTIGCAMIHRLVVV